MKETKDKYAVIRAVMIPTQTGNFQYIPLEMEVTCYENGKEVHEYSSLIRIDESTKIPEGLPSYLSPSNLQTAPDMIEVLQYVNLLIKNRTLVCEDQTKIKQFLEHALGKKLSNNFCEKIPEYA